MAKDEFGIPHNWRKVHRRLRPWRSSHTGRLKRRMKKARVARQQGGVS